MPTDGILISVGRTPCVLVGAVPSTPSCGRLESATDWSHVLSIWHGTKPTESAGA